MKPVCVYTGQTQRAQGFLPRSRVGPPAQAVLFQTQNFFRASQKPDPGQKLPALAPNIPPPFVGRLQMGKPARDTAGVKGGEGWGRGDPEKRRALKIAFPPWGGIRNPRSCPAGVTLTRGQGFLTRTGTQGQGAAAQRGCRLLHGAGWERGANRPCRRGQTPPAANGERPRDLAGTERVFWQ